jgi:crotonobetainyl-CoA:carnitine CoA-transferase CaiB-like acyl-CoA transferase
MKLLSGQRVAVIGMHKSRPLLRYLESLGAEIVGELDNPSALINIDFLVDSVGLKVLEMQGWSRQTIKKINPALVHVSISAFGSHGAGSEFLGSELVASAMSGTLRLTGNPDRPPVKEALNACTFHAEMAAAAGAMVAHFERTQTGIGQHVDISVQEVAFNRNVSSILAWQFDKRKLFRSGGALSYNKVSVRCIWKLADGWCFHSLMTGRFGAPANQALSDWMDESGILNPMQEVDWLSYNRSTLSSEIRQEWETAMAAFFKTCSKDKIITEGQVRGLNACVLAEPADVLADPHLQARDFWDNNGALKIPGRFARIIEGAISKPRKIERSDRPGPLSGVRVLDFSWALVGSVTTKTLGDLGADVIKVESRTRPCLSRLDVQVSASNMGNFDDKPWFAHLNSSKRSLSLDMKKPEAMEILGPLIEWADVVVENFSPGTMAKLGLDYDSMIARNPSIVMVSGSVYGQTGPLAKEWGVDGTGGALSSRTFLTGWPDRDPVIPGSVPFGDVIVPFVMAATAVAVLAQRDISGRGAHVDASMYEICVQQMYDAFSQAQSGIAPQRQGNDDPDWFKQGLWPTRGDDRWIAISIRDEEQWQILCEIAGGTDIEAWTAGQVDYEVMSLLNKAGIAAGVVQDIEDVFRDQTLLQRGSLMDLPHAILGNFGHVRTPIDFSDSEVYPFSAPAMGEHNDEIAMGIAGLSNERKSQLDKLGVFK